jgi:hypothetical protein
MNAKPITIMAAIAVIFTASCVMLLQENALGQNATNAATGAGQDEGVTICESTTGRLASMKPSPDGNHIVCISHNNDDVATPFHISVDGHMITKVKMLASGGIYWSPDNKAFGWWKSTDNGWVPIVTSVEGKELFSGAELCKTLAMGQTGLHNTSSTFESGPTKISYYFDSNGVQYIGGEPQNGDVAAAFLAVSDGGQQVGWFVGTYATNKVVSWRYQGADKRPAENYDYVWWPSLVPLRKQGEVAFSIQRQTNCFIVCGAKEYGPYEGNSRIYVNQDGSGVAWFGRIDKKWFLFVNGIQKAGPFEDTTCAQFLHNGEVAYVATRGDKLLAVGADGESALERNDFIAGPCFSPDGRHVAYATTQKGLPPWPAKVTVDGKKVFGDFPATTYEEGNYTKLDMHGVLSLSWRTGSKGENILRALVLREKNVVRLEKTF